MTGLQIRLAMIKKEMFPKKIIRQAFLTGRLRSGGVFYEYETDIYGV
jgi:hypothetical protein